MVLGDDSHITEPIDGGRIQGSLEPNEVGIDLAGPDLRNFHETTNPREKLFPQMGQQYLEYNKWTDESGPKEGIEGVCGWVFKVSELYSKPISRARRVASMRLWTSSLP
jgi:hypothetical protein